MSVAASRSSVPCASTRIPDRICTDVRVDTARETTPRAETSSSFETVILSPVPTTMSVSSILFIPCSSHRECGRRGRRRETAWLSQDHAVQALWRDVGYRQGSLLPHLFDASCQLLDEVVHRSVLTDQTRDLRGRVDDGRVV